MPDLKRVLALFFNLSLVLLIIASIVVIHESGHYMGAMQLGLEPEYNFDLKDNLEKGNLASVSFNKAGEAEHRIVELTPSLLFVLIVIILLPLRNRNFHTFFSIRATFLSCFIHTPFLVPAFVTLLFEAQSRYVVDYMVSTVEVRIERIFNPSF